MVPAPEPDERRVFDEAWRWADSISGQLSNLDSKSQADSPPQATPQTETDSRFRECVANEDWRRVPGPDVAGHLVDLVRALTQAWKPSSIFDPYVFAPAILGEAARGLGVEHAIGIVPNERHAELLVDAPNQLVTWVAGRPGEARSEISGQFDLAITAPPFGIRCTRKLPGELRPEIYRRELGYWLIAAAAQTIASDGHCIFLTGDAFFSRKSALELREHLGRQGVYFSAAIAVPQGFGHPVTNMMTNLVVFDREKHDTVFVGHLTVGGDPSTLVRNLLDRRPGKALQNGALVAPEAYKRWSSFVREHALRRRFSSSTAPLIPLAEISTDIVAVASTSPEADDKPTTNAIYVQGVRGVVSLEPLVQTDGSRAPRKAYLVVLDPKRARADYVAWWLGSNAGKVARGASLAGANVPRLTLDAVRNLLIPLPPIKEQRRTIGLHARLIALQAEAEAVEKALILSPAEATGLSERLSAHWEDPLDTWVSRLPFPLASIADRYIADASPDKKIERLLHFFEAYAEFGVAVLLAAARRDEALWRDKLTYLGELGPRNRHPLEEATFGSWTTLGFKLAKMLRAHLQNAHGAEELAEARASLFAISDPNFADGFLGKRLWAALEQACVARNSYSHGRAVGARAKQDLLTGLETLLGELREVTERTFVSAVLILPGPGEFDGELHLHGSSKRMTGPSSTFRERPLESLVQLKAREAYFVEEGDDGEPVSAALELAPLFRMMASPESEENACFFCNGRGPDQHFTYVSYHFGGRPTQDTPDAALERLMQELATGAVEQRAPR